MGRFGHEADEQMKLPESPQRMRQFVVGLAVAAAMVCAAAIFDKMRFERSCRVVKTVSNELGGHPYFIGDWPIGREYFIRFDAPLTDDALRHLAAVAPKMRRIYLILAFKCEIPDARLDDMRTMVASHGGIKIVVSPATEREKVK